MVEAMEFGIGTRRRPIGRDYAAAKDAECGKLKQRSEGGRKEDGKMRRCEGGRVREERKVRG
jgi:hypothetical protein